MSRLAGEPLARTFGVMGLCVAVLVATLDPSRDVQLSGVVWVIGGTALAGWVIGRVRAWNHVLPLCVFVGWLLAIGVAPYWAPIDGWSNVVWAFVGIPALVTALSFVGRGIGRAAAFSVLDRSSRRALVAAAAAVIGVVAWATIRAGTHEPFVPLMMGAGAFVTTLMMVFCDLRASLGVRDERAMLDFGAGEQRMERHEDVPASYRTTAIVVRVEHRSRAHALRWIARAIAIELVALAIAGAAATGAGRDAMAMVKEPPHACASTRLR